MTRPATDRKPITRIHMTMEYIQTGARRASAESWKIQAYRDNGPDPACTVRVVYSPATIAGGWPTIDEVCRAIEGKGHDSFGARQAALTLARPRRGPEAALSPPPVA